MSDITTVQGSRFPVIDISHKPKRYQNAEGTPYKQRANVQLNQVPSVSDFAKMAENLEIPSFITIEKVIKLYEGSNNELFITTAKWLREYLELKNHKYEGGEKNVSELQNEK